MIRRNISTGPHFLGLGAQAGLSEVQLEKNLICNSVVMTGSPSGDGKTETYAHDDPAIKAVLEKTGNIIDVDDPGLVDPAEEDFRLRRDSPARKLGMQSLPFGEMGLQRDEYRKHLPVRAPDFAPASRFFVTETDVRLVPCKHGAPAAIHYTLDGTEPTLASPSYHRPIHLVKTTTIRAKAFGRGALAVLESEVASATFTGGYLGADHGAYLSDLDEIEYIGDDGLGSGGLLKDKARHGQPIRLGGKPVDKALMTEPVETPEGPRSRVTYALTGNLSVARRFKAAVGADDSTSPDAGSCGFVVEVRAGGQWRRVYDSGELGPKAAPGAVDIELSGADRLRLTVEGRGANHRWPRAVWGAARLE